MHGTCIISKTLLPGIKTNRTEFYKPHFETIPKGVVTNASVRDDEFNFIFSLVLFALDPAQQLLFSSFSTQRHTDNVTERTRVARKRKYPVRFD